MNNNLTMNCKRQDNTLYRKVKDTDFTIDLINVKPSIKKIFTITELDKVFRID